MRDQARIKPYEPNVFFEDNQSNRLLVENTVARGQLRADEHRYTGQVDGQPVDTFPFPIEPEDLERGRQRYEAFCAPCHGLSGYGNGVVVDRGFPAPQSFHIDRLRESPAGYYFNVITNGFGRMYPYDYRIEPDDRWRIIAYIRALQLSQNAQVEDVPADQLPQLEGAQR
jgi:cytochrome c